MKFSVNSKPKILNYGKNIFNYFTNDIEIISLGKCNISDIIELNPDLVVSDEGQIKGLPDLLGNYEYLKYKWLVLPEKSDIWIHACAVESSLTKNSDLISIFTSSYNIGDKIRETYFSLSNQTYENWEWVIVDDSTNSDTWRVLIDISENDPRVKIHSFRSKSRGCIGEAKYRAAMLCNGEYLVELDHDDILTDDCLELLVKAYKEFPECGFAYSDSAEINQHLESHTYPDGFAFGYSHHYETEYKGKIYYPATAPKLNPKSIRHIVSVPNHVRSWRRNVYFEIGGHNRSMRIADDYELIIRTFLKTQFVHIPKLLYLQRFDGNNSQDQFGNRADIQLRVKEIASFYSNQITKRFEELGIDDFCKGIDLDTVYNTVHDPNTPSAHKTLII